MNLREDVLDMINSDLKLLVNLNIFDAHDHVSRMTHTEVMAYLMDFDVYKDVA